LASRPETAGLYFTVGTFDAKGTFRRTAENARQFGAIAIDLDVGEGKPYAEQRAALRHAIELFSEVLGVDVDRECAVIDSGGGVHVYLPLSAPLPRDEWLSRATDVKRALLAAGLGLDPAVTADAARIMRVPGTLNRKIPGRPRPCRVLRVPGGRIDPEDLARRIAERASRIDASPAANVVPLRSPPPGRTNDINAEALASEVVPLEVVGAALAAHDSAAADDRNTCVRVLQALAHDHGDAGRSCAESFCRRSEKFDGAWFDREWSDALARAERGASRDPVTCRSILAAAIQTGRFIDPRRPGAPAAAGAAPSGEPRAAGADAPVEVDLVQLAESQPRPPEFIVPEWLPAGEVTLLAADGGTGKSSVALGLGVSIALGKDFCGIPVERRRVIFVSFEDSTEVLHWRLCRICAALGVSASELQGRMRLFDGTRCLSSWYSRGEFGAAGPTSAFHEFAERVGSEDAVVIVDGASDTFAGNENDRAQVKAFIRMLRTLCGRAGAVLLLAHVDKQSARTGAEALGFSGSTGWNNGVRCRWYMYRETGGEGRETGDVVIEVRKSNLAPAGAQVVVRFDESGGVFRRVDTPAQGAASRVLDEANAVLGIIRAASAAGNPVPASTTGSRTAHSVCGAHDTLPAGLRGQRGRRKFYEVLERLRASGAVVVEPVRRPGRRVVEVLRARD
jgi:hypothetical protein